MISTALAVAIADLRSALVLPDEVEGDGSAWNDAFAAALDRVVVLGEPAAVAPLLLLIDDSYELDHMNWALAHAAEGFPLRAYVAGLLQAIPTLTATSPDWARQLVARVLNGDACRRLLADALAETAEETRTAFIPILRRLAQDNPAQFGASAGWITMRLCAPRLG